MEQNRSSFLLLTALTTLLSAMPAFADDFWDLPAGAQQEKADKKADGDFWELPSGGQAEPQQEGSTSDEDFWSGQGNTSLDRFMTEREEDRLEKERRRQEEKEKRQLEEQRREAEAQAARERKEAEELRKKEKRKGQVVAEPRRKDKKHGTSRQKASSSSDAEYVKRVCYFPKKYGEVRQVLSGNGRSTWDYSEHHPVPSYGTVILSDAQSRKAMGIASDDKSTLKSHKQTIEESFTLWFANPKGGSYYEEYAIIKDVMVYNKASRGFASQTCNTPHNFSWHDNALSAKIAQRNRRSKQSPRVEVKLFDGRDVKMP